MSMLVDTNVLLRRLEMQHPHHAAASAAVSRLLRRSEQLYVTLQNLTEAWHRMTVPTNANGLGFTVSVAATAIDQITRLLVLLPEDTPAVSREWRQLVERYQVSGRAVFDARLAATMLVHKIDSILTFNMRDFSRYGVTALDPATV
ncbi:MAG TPA: PIN domain-containing protein [Stellaceae bacterium]|jgi:predicted nucleic acid-binding protein